MSRNTSLPQDSEINSNLEQHTGNVISTLDASVKATVSNIHSTAAEKERRCRDETKSAQDDVGYEGRACFQVKNTDQISVLSSTVEKYDSLTNYTTQMCGSNEQKKQKTGSSPVCFSGRLQTSQDKIEDMFSALHPLHQLSDIALRQLEAVNQMATLQEDLKPARDSSSKISSYHGEKATIQTETTKQITEKTITNNIINGEKKVEIEKSKIKPKKDNLRKGKWTAEEEEYTMRIIQHFRTGLLTLPDGHTLRSYLAEKLNCDPMRITKKFSGASCLGKRVYNLCDRSQISARDLDLAMAELDELENRFKLRIEHGSSLPFPSRLSDRFRNSCHDIDHANFLRASNYHFVNNLQQNHGSGHTLEHDNFQASQLNIMQSLNDTDANIQLALLQNFVTTQNQLGLSMSMQGANYTNNDSNQNRYQLPNHSESSHFPSNSINTNLNFFESRQRQQQQQQHSQVHSHLLTALLNSQTSGYNSIGQMNGQVQQLSLQLQAEAMKALAVTSNSPFQRNQTSAAISPRDNSSDNTASQESSLSVASATEALAASYKNAARQHQLMKECEEKRERKNSDHLSQKTGETGKNMNKEESSKRVRTQQEQADGRMLLGFLQELQNNHLKATMSLSNTAQDSLSTGPMLQSTNASSDGTATSSCDSKRYNILKKGYNISVKKDSDMETASSVSGFNSSDVPKNEPLSGSSGGSSGGDSSDDNKGGLSGDDTERNVRAGPPRKRFRREFKSSAKAQDYDEDFQN